MATHEQALADLVRSQRLGTLATIRRDGRPQLSNILYAVDDDVTTIRISVTDDRAKTRNLRRDPRASLHVQGDDGWSYAVVEAEAELTSPTTVPDDATADDLVVLYRDLAGEHPDWDEYRQAMIDERRLVLRLHVERTYGLAR
jgi:PPOX class probable F420-dependent enzyme